MMLFKWKQVLNTTRISRDMTNEAVQVETGLEHN